MPTDALFALGMLKLTSRMFASQQRRRAPQQSTFDSTPMARDPSWMDDGLDAVNGVHGRWQAGRRSDGVLVLDECAQNSKNRSTPQMPNAMLHAGIV